MKPKVCILPEFDQGLDVSVFEKSGLKFYAKTRFRQLSCV